MILIAAVIALATAAPVALADIPWPEVKKRAAEENAALAARPQGHDNTYFVICTLYYTPLESGITVEGGFDVTPVEARGLGGRSYPREFLAAVKKEGVGRLAEPVKESKYIAYDGEDSYRFVREICGRGRNVLVPRQSAAARTRQSGLPPNTEFTIKDPAVRDVFGSADWKIVDTGGGLKNWQVDLYWGEDEPRGPGKQLARPKGTEFEYGYSEVTVKEKPEKEEGEEEEEEEEEEEGKGKGKGKGQKAADPIQVEPEATLTPTPTPDDG